MEAYLYLEAHRRAIEAATDFTYTWCTNMGMETDEAARFTLAVDELLTDMILFAFPEGGNSGYIEIWYRFSIPQLEIIIQESGEPFDPDRYRYSRKKALEKGDFEGAGLELVNRLADHFLFLNLGKKGKEFRLAKQLSEQKFSGTGLEEAEENGADNGQQDVSSYELSPVTKEDAEDIAKLIYRSYDYSYIKEDLYFPKQNELAIEHGKKFGTIIRTAQGMPVGYFTVIKIPDSLVGEVGEAVVSPPYRRKGLMTRMLNELIDMSQKRGLRGLYGLALTVHSISQKVNRAFGFSSTALLVGVTKGSKYKDSLGDYPQPVSLLVDFLPLTKKWQPSVYLPSRYRSMLLQLYRQFDVEPAEQGSSPGAAETEMDVKFTYRNKTANIVVTNLGDSFVTTARSMMRSLGEVDLNAVYIDIPLEDRENDEAVEWLYQNGFIFSGLMPMVHDEKDYLRMQKIMVPINFELIDIYSETAQQLKDFIHHEYYELQEE